jgi:hypothetical protein
MGNGTGCLLVSHSDHTQLSGKNIAKHKQLPLTAAVFSVRPTIQNKRRRYFGALLSPIGV